LVRYWIACVIGPHDQVIIKGAGKERIFIDVEDLGELSIDDVCAQVVQEECFTGSFLRHMLPMIKNKVPVTQIDWGQRIERW